jgi:hypothetical protein
MLLTELLGIRLLLVKKNTKSGAWAFVEGGRRTPSGAEVNMPFKFTHCIHFYVLSVMQNP